MKVYVESNFVMQLALKQEEALACEQLLQLAEAKRLRLAIPAYAFLEPEGTLHKRVGKWKRLADKVDRELSQIARTSTVRADAGAVRGVFLKAVQVAAGGIEETRTRILDAAEVLDISGMTLREATVLRGKTELELEDAVMLASVLADPVPEPGSVFINTNSKDFGDLRVREELKARGVHYIAKFTDGLNRVRAALGEP